MSTTTTDATERDPLYRAHYRAAVLAEVAGLLRHGVGPCSPEEGLARLEASLRELTALLGELRQDPPA